MAPRKMPIKRACYAHLEYAYWCTHCPRSYVRRDSLFRHMKRAHPDAPDKYRCAYCRRKFTDRAEYVSHSTAHKMAGDLILPRAAGAVHLSDEAPAPSSIKASQLAMKSLQSSIKEEPSSSGKSDRDRLKYKSCKPLFGTRSRLSHHTACRTRSAMVEKNGEENQAPRGRRQKSLGKEEEDGYGFHKLGCIVTACASFVGFVLRWR